jgi:hypothetical protein
LNKFSPLQKCQFQEAQADKACDAEKDGVRPFKTNGQHPRKIWQKCLDRKQNKFFLLKEEG